VVEVAVPEVGGDDRTACRNLVDALPDRVADQDRRPVEPDSGLSAAWGDPAIVLRCGVPTPAALDEFAACQEANGVGWFVPEEQVEDQHADVVMTTIGRAQNVEVRVPATYRPPAAAMVDLAAAIKTTIVEEEPCV